MIAAVRTACFSLIAAAALAAPAHAEAPVDDPLAAAGYVVVEPDARISASRSLNGYEVLADDQIILRAGANRLYRAVLNGSCGNGLKFEWTLGVDAKGGGGIDRFSDVIINGRRCGIRSLDRVERAPQSAESRS